MNTRSAKISQESVALPWVRNARNNELGLMAHLPIRETGDRIDLAVTLQYCIRRARFYRILTNVNKVIAAIGGIFILALLRLWNPQAGASTSNKVVIGAILVTASLISIALSLGTALNFERESTKYETASRAIRRLRDKYELEIKKTGNDTVGLETWAKEHVYKIESLLEDSRVFDVNFHFQISEPLRIT